ncbi:Gfo/Idh/MocA family oxidoreductase [Roseomonas sp. PWR1]|uniref:Gfo/Idh/MocA family oxidoreductase n=1 Tax=Roseomonas nitratireducens TaxID=2820810 RepID=A0ABS4ANX1_9PROT|nr:Gfo/Idh/MocA family oxidoreductase [Neoroseomonas nitratireducens]MBP0462952.1 Gfo/Idh/MocA family oxidoreductase [Neoroseomonas nitratireducens]
MLEAAIVGMGRWGQTLVDSVQGSNEAGIRFVAGCTGRPERAAEWAARQGVRILPDFEAVLADPAVKAVAIASPHGMHAAQVVAAARAGKHVFVEKPFTLTKASAEQAVAACRAAGVVMALGHNRRFLPAVAEMKAMLADGRLGSLLHVEGQFSGPGALSYKPGMWRADRGESPLGGMGGMGIHMVDMFINLAGPIAEVTVQSHAKVIDNGLDDTTAALMRFENGATATFATLAYAPRYWRVALFGTDGVAELHGHERLSYTPREGEGWVRDFPKTDIERAELAAFAAAVAGGPAYPLPVEQAIHGVAVYEAMIGAAASGSTYRVA